MAKTREEISESIRDYIINEDRQTNADISEGTVYRDIAIEYIANKLSDISTDIEESYNSSSLIFFDILSEDGMSQLALNYFVTRDPATKSVGFIRFTKKSQPTGTISIPVGTIIQTKRNVNNQRIQFKTTENAFFTISTPLDVYTRQYHVFVPIEAIIEGSSGNVGKYSITNMENIIQGIDSVTNILPTSGGTDIEGNESLANKCLEVTQQRILGTKAGYIQALEEYSPLITDVNVVTQRDSEMLRDVYGGSIDIYINGSDPQSFNYNTNYNPGKDYIWINELYRPTLSVSSVVGTTTSTIYLDGTDWYFSKSINQTTGYSVKAYDVINWIDGGNKPFALEQLTITGIYENLVRGAQDYIDSPTRRFVTADQLVKNMTRIGIQVSANILAYSGYDRTDLSNTLEVAITNGITAYNSGENVEQADLVKLLYSSSNAVDRVYLPFNFLCKTGESGSSDIEINRNEFARIDGITITVL